MKPITFLISLFLLTSFTILPDTKWLTNFEEAKSQAADTKKHILLNFSGSDWCAPCIRLRTEIFASGAFLEYAEDNLVLVNADFPRLRKNQLDKTQTLHNEGLAEAYNADGKFPLTLLLNSSGKVIKQWEGLPQKSPEQFVEEIKKTLIAGTTVSK